MKEAALSIFLLLFVATGAAAWWFWHDMKIQLNIPLPVTSEIEYTIRPGMSLKTVCRELQEMGIITHAYILVLEAYQQGTEGGIKAGEYLITPGTTPLQLLEQFVAGRVRQYAMTLIEGWTFAQMMEVGDPESTAPAARIN
jgi:Predicted periplasmic solute-binding protein